MSLVLYFHPVSQPSRAVHALLELGKVEHTTKVIDIMKGEQKTPEYYAITPSQQVPAIQDGDFSLFESHAILKYLATTRPSLNSFYPSDPKARASTDCYLDWHHSGTRKITHFLRVYFFGPVFWKTEVPAGREEKLAEVEKQLEFFEKVFLGGEKQYKYINNSSVPTIADLSAHAEISTLEFINYDFSKYPTLAAWLGNLYQVPEVKQAYTVHHGLVKQTNPDLNEFNRKNVGA